MSCARTNQLDQHVIVFKLVKPLGLVINVFNDCLYFLNANNRVHFVRVETVHHAFTFTVERLTERRCFYVLFKSNLNIQDALSVTNIKHIIQKAINF